MKNKFLLILCFTLANGINAQDKKEKWDVQNPPGIYQEVNLDLSEGTWMNLDVSPDGKTIVFDLLGDIYQMSMSGGKATLLRGGLAWEIQPRYSADGQQILFTSDAGGGDNIWRMRADGNEAKQVTKESFRLLNNPEWIPNTDYFVARKHFTSERSLGAGEIWMYHLSGGEGIQLTKRKNDQQDVNEPSVSSDGRYIYFSEDMYPGGFFQYNKDPNSQIYVIKQYDRETGKTKQILGGPGGACRPQISPNGKKLAYVRRIREESVLIINDLETGRDYPIYRQLSKDQQEAWAIFGTYPGFDWTPDGENIIIWAEGKIKRINVNNQKSSTIPFSLTAKHRMAETVLFKQKVTEPEFEIKVLRQLVTSPDHKTLIFNSLGSLWSIKYPNGKPKRISPEGHLEFEPAFSPDGQTIVFVSWDDTKMGQIIKQHLSSGQRTVLTTEKGIYRTPSFSPDGKQITYRKEAGNTHQGFIFSNQPGIYIMKADGNDAELISPQGEYPQFTADGKSIFYQKGGYLFGSLKKSLNRINLDKTNDRIIFNTKYTNQFVPSPDNRWIAFTELFKVYIAPMPAPGQPIGLAADTKAFPVAQVARDAGINLHWSADSKQLHWTLGNEYFTSKLTDRFLFLEGSVDSIPPIDTAGVAIRMMQKTDQPNGSLVLQGAKIITMKGTEVIENGVIVIVDNKIKSIGTADAVNIPKNAKIIDVTGKTIMPGIVDVHAHLGAFRFGLSPQKHWQYYANLAYGVTTTHDPSANTEMTFAQSEMVKAGVMVGPRIFSTGTILYGADGDFKAVINNLEDARSALRRTKAYGAFSVKSYNQPRREQRQQVMQAARELSINVYPEGGSTFFHNMTMVADGHTGVEHNIPVAPLFADVIGFWSATKSGNTPTLIVNYGGVNGEFYWYQNTKVWEKERLTTFTPRPIVDSRSRHRVMVPQEEYENGHILTSQSCKKLQDAGVGIQLGSHGQLQGLGAHWELWMMVQGGMSNANALRAATLDGARYLGMDEEIGSLEVGKLADLIVLDKDPLADIQNSEFVKYTMINGRLYDAATMNEVGLRPTERGQFYWELEGSGHGYPFYPDTRGFMKRGCVCGQ